MRIVLTHSEGRLLGLEEGLRAMGHWVKHLPLVRTRPIEDVSLASVGECRWWLFTSQSAASAVLALGDAWRDHKIAVVGGVTAGVFEKAGRGADLISPQAGAASLAEAFLRRGAGGPVGLLQAEHPLPVLRERLVEAGMVVRALAVYRTEILSWPRAVSPPDLVVVASPSAVSALPDVVIKNSFCIALGATSAGYLRRAGAHSDVVASPGAAAVLAWVKAAGETTGFHRSDGLFLRNLGG